MAANVYSTAAASLRSGLTRAPVAGKVGGVTGRIAALVAMSAMLAVPAAATAKTGSVFDMSRATGYVRVTFTGDSAGSCASFGVCGYSGTVTYRVGGKPHGTLVLARGRNGRISGGATYRTTATTRASVTAPAGGWRARPRCPTGRTCSRQPPSPTAPRPCS